MTPKTNKGNTSPRLKERASAPGIGKGSVTVEASVGIPLFLFAAVCLIWMIEIQSIRVSMLNASVSAAKSAAEDTAVIPVLNTIRLKSDIVSLIGEDRISRSLISGGTSGISCWKSHVSPATGDMEITVEYPVQLPLPLFGEPEAELEETFTVSAWTGASYGEDGTGGGDGRIVYVTDNREVYHEDYRCSHLQLSIRFVPAEELDQMRNADGSRYHACDKCVFGEAMTGVYITEDGSKYHNSLGCSGLKRSIQAVGRSEVSGMEGCSRCSGQTS